jgi:hypothetical protein
MIQPLESRIPLPVGGAWPSSLIALDIDPAVTLEVAIKEAASAARRFRQGVRAWWHDAPMVAFPSDETVEILQRFERCKLDVRRVENPNISFPDPGANSRWTANRKLLVLVAIGGGRMTPAQAAEWWGIDQVELAEWAQRFELYGFDGLKLAAVNRVGRLVTQLPEVVAAEKG